MGGGDGLWIGRRQIAKLQQPTASRWFLQEWVFKKKGESCARVSWEILIGHISQIINFDCWTLVFCLSNESVIK